MPTIPVLEAENAPEAGNREFLNTNSTVRYEN